MASVALFEVIEEHTNGRTVLRFLEGAMAGRTVIAFPESECLPNYVRRLTPSERAEILLRSLLDADQQAQWGRSQRFRVCTRYGEVEFGRMHDIGFWPDGGGEFRLCVVPAGRGATLPEPDVWTNLLLVVRAEPERFFAVANWRRPNGPWRPPPLPSLRASSM
jgi:hypothetical protein